MSKAFVDAAASYLGMDPARLHEGHLVSNAEGLTVRLIVKLTDEDILGAADRMRQMTSPTEEEQTGVWVGMPSLQEVMRDPLAYAGRPECADLLAKAASMSQRVARVLGLEPDPFTLGPIPDIPMPNPGSKGGAPFVPTPPPNREVIEGQRPKPVIPQPTTGRT